MFVKELKQNKNFYLILFVYLSAFVFIKMFRIDSKNYIYISMFFSWIFFIYCLIFKNINYSNKFKNFFLFEKLILIYTVYCIILSMIVDYKSIIYTINMLGAFIVVIPVLKVFSDERQIFDNISKIVSWIFIISGVISLILLLLGYSKIAFDINSGIVLTPSKIYLNYEGQYRLTWLMSQKSRYGIYCLLGISYLFYENINKKIKIAGISILYINLFFTSSVTSIGLGILLIGVFLSGKIKKYFKKNKKISIISLFIISISSGIFVYLVSMKRNIFTLGSRIYIWESSINQILKKPFGIISMGEDFLMENKNLNFEFTNGHNIFLNEAIERGIVGLIIFVLILVSIMFVYYKYKRNNYIYINMIFLLGGMMEYTLSEEMIYIYMLINVLWISRCVWGEEYDKDEKSICSNGCL